MKISNLLRALALGLMLVFAGTAAHAQQSATQPLTITVTAQPVSITTIQTQVPNAVATVAYAGATFQSSGGVGPYTYSISAGTLPAGVTLSAGGVLSGTPTTAGTSNFTVKATDSQGTPATGTKAFTIIVYSQLVITTTTLPGATLNQPYNTTVAFTGGTAPFTCSVNVGTLPTGLTIGTSGTTCTITGTPTAVGSTNFTIQVTDTSAI